MNIIVINGTERRGCTYAMKEMFLDTIGRDHRITEISLPADCPSFCTGCKACFFQDISVCPHAQYTVPIWNAILSADLLVFTSPVYVFHATAQMKALLDHYGTKWMAHSPDKEMFSKQAVIIVGAAGAGMNGVVKDISDSLHYWGVARTHSITQSLFESRWELVEDTRKTAIRRQCEQVCRRIKTDGNIKPALGVRGRFFLMRMAQNMIHRDLQKKGQHETRDYMHWKEKGWLDGKKPWK